MKMADKIVDTFPISENDKIFLYYKLFKLYCTININQVNEGDEQEDEIDFKSLVKNMSKTSLIDVSITLDKPGKIAIRSSQDTVTHSLHVRP
eukprot:Pgem_evm1s150